MPFTTAIAKHAIPSTTLSEPPKTQTDGSSTARPALRDITTTAAAAAAEPNASISVASSAPSTVMKFVQATSMDSVKSESASGTGVTSDEKAVWFEVGSQRFQLDSILRVVSEMKIIVAECHWNR